MIFVPDSLAIIIIATLSTILIAIVFLSIVNSRVIYHELLRKISRRSWIILILLFLLNISISLTFPDKVDKLYLDHDISSISERKKKTLESSKTYVLRYGREIWDSQDKRMVGLSIFQFYDKDGKAYMVGEDGVFVEADL